MKIKEACDVIDLAVEKWHCVAQEHEIKPCNCFKEEFGRAIMKKYSFSGEEMIKEWKRR